MRKEIIINENEEPQNYENFEYAENIEANLHEENNELLDDKNLINNDEINVNENYENMENMENLGNIGNIGNVNNIHSNIEIFEDVNNHIEEMIDNNDNYNNNDDINNGDDKEHHHNY